MTEAPHFAVWARIALNLGASLNSISIPAILWPGDSQIFVSGWYDAVWSHLQPQFGHLLHSTQICAPDSTGPHSWHFVHRQHSAHLAQMRHPCAACFRPHSAHLLQSVQHTSHLRQPRQRGVQLLHPPHFWHTPWSHTSVTQLSHHCDLYGSIGPSFSMRANSLRSRMSWSDSWSRSWYCACATVAARRLTWIVFGGLVNMRGDVDALIRALTPRHGTKIGRAHD